SNHWPAHTWRVAKVGPDLEMTAARLMPGAISLRISSHFPLVPYSNVVKPVALPPGRARLSTKPAPTGSATFTNTIGPMRVACSNGPTAGVAAAKMGAGGGGAHFP